ncbi:hypothetical protein CAP36_11355 [Chitinophagaceae bacterium IBVUCB2]|nr:hypothetical protein CAP36_11355 [Chitinophagaceae bacterium IBVUCB2]
MKLLVFASLFLLTLMSCSNPISKILGNNTPHEGYARKMEKTTGGNYWITVSENSLLAPHSIKLPYRQLGYFPKDKARALSLQFNVRRGEKLSIELNSTDSLQIFADVFKQEGAGINHLIALGKDDSVISFDAEETGSYILRLQPPLESSGRYDLAIKLFPSLEFPVAGKKARVGSVWGDPRDNGLRSHEGIDIFAPKLTPVIAAADGTISSVKDGGLGGKTVNLKVSGRNLSLYYAHLDQQLVQSGQSVKKGDTIGLVGNTGNAQTTPPHLHFGIYSYGGAIDPLPFVDKTSDPIPAVANKDIIYPLQLTKEILLKDKSTIKAKTKLLPLAVTVSGYLAELESGKLIEVRFNQVKKA